MSGWASTPPARDHSVPTTGIVLKISSARPYTGPAELLLDAVHDRRGVGRDGAGVVRHEQRAAVGGDLLQPLPLHAVPAAVHRAVDLAGQLPHVLGAAPLVDVGAARVGEAVAAPASLGTGTSAIDGLRAVLAPPGGSACGWPPCGLAGAFRGFCPGAVAIAADGSGRGLGALPVAVERPGRGRPRARGSGVRPRRCAAAGTTGTAARPSAAARVPRGAAPPRPRRRRRPAPARRAAAPRSPAPAAAGRRRGSRWPSTRGGTPRRSVSTSA